MEQRVARARLVQGLSRVNFRDLVEGVSLVSGGALWAFGAVTVVLVGLEGGWLAQVYFWIALATGVAVLGAFGVLQFVSFWQPEPQPVPSPLRVEDGRFNRAEISEVERRLVEENQDGEQHFRSSVVVITGRSGAGKSWLVEHELKEMARRHGWIVCPPIDGFRHLENFKALLKKALDETGFLTLGADDRVTVAESVVWNGPGEFILVFEHFEQFLSSRTVGKQERGWFARDVLARVKELALSRVAVVLVVRKDSYLDLRVFENVIQLHEDTIELVGIGNPDVKNIDVNIRSTLKDVAPEDELYKRVLSDLKLDKGEGLPLEVRLVHLMLQEVKREKGPLEIRDYVKEGESAGLIDRYFLRCTEARDTDLVRSVFYALCATPTDRRSFSIEELSAVTHREKRLVKGAVRWLLAQDLIKETGDRYEISHDYYARHFHELSGILLEPINRDSIAHGVSVLGTDRAPRIDVRADEGISKESVMYVGLLLVLLARFAGPSYGVRWQAFEEWAGLGGYLGNTAMRAPFVDLLYLPSLIASAFSSWYTYRIHKYVLMVVATSPREKVASYISLGTCYLMTLAGVVLPRWWALFAGVGGMVLGLRLCLLCWSLGRRGGWRRSVTLDYLRGIGLYTVLNCGVLAIGGLAYGNAMEWATVREGLVEWLLFLELCVAMMFAAFMLYVVREETTASRSAMLLGLADR